MDEASRSHTMRPRWWRTAHALVAIHSLVVIVTVGLKASWVLWLAWAAMSAVLSLGLQWQMGALDAHKGRGHFLLTILRITASASILCALSMVHPAFAGAFIALPFAVAQLTSKTHPLRWALASANFSWVLVGTDLGLTWTVPVFALSCGAGLFTHWMPLRKQDASSLPEYSPPNTAPIRSELLTPSMQDQSAHNVTVERLHEMVSIVRASTRGSFAAVYWLDDVQQVMIPAVIETATPQKIYDGPIAVSTAFEPIDILATPLVECTPPSTPAWYLDAQDNAVPPNVLIAHIQDEGILLGILIVERSVDRGPFHHADHISIRKCAHLAALQRRDEQAAISAAKTSHDLQVVAHAAEQLSDTLNEEEVYRIGAALFSDLLPGVDVIFVRQAHDDGLEIAYVSDGWAGFSIGDELPAQQSLVALAMERRHALPYRAGGEDDDPPLFGLHARTDDLHRHLIYPLISGRVAHSAVVLRVPQRGVFHRTARERLGLLSNQIAAALGIARAYETMAQRAAHDGMTQLLNRASFEEQSVLALQRAVRSERPLSMLIMDIDHFKSVNDTYGHAIGDAVIRAVANTIRSQVRRIDIAARYGGEEFVVVLEDTDIQGAMLFAERLRERMASLTHHADHKTFRATISIGVAAFPHHAADIQTLLAYADHALYQSKHGGRNRVTAWSQTAQQAPSIA